MGIDMKMLKIIHMTVVVTFYMLWVLIKNIAISWWKAMGVIPTLINQGRSITSIDVDTDVEITATKLKGE